MATGTSTQATLTNGRVLRIALPIMLSNATVPLLGIVDTGVVGQLGEAAPIGAVGLGAVILSALFWVFGFLRMGTSGLTAQARGAGDKPEEIALLVRAILIAVGAGTILVITQALIIPATLSLSPASAEVESLAATYMHIRIWSAPAAIALFGVTGWLIALERTRAVLAIQIWMNGLNMLLDIWFVLSLGWGVSGVALASVLAEWSGFVLALWFCRRALLHPAARVWRHVLNKARLLRMASVNGDILLRTLMLETIFVSFMFLGARFGDTTLAANQVLLQFMRVTAYALDGFAYSAEALVGQAMGARARGALRRAAVLTSQWGLGICVAMSAGFALVGPAAIDILTTSDEVRAASREYLPWIVVAPVVGVAGWMFDGIFIGATRTRDMRNMMFVCLLLYTLTAVALLPLMGNHGLWAALMISLAARGGTLALRYPALERSVSGTAA